MFKLTRFQKHTFAICALPILAILIAQATKGFRFSEYRNIYLAGVAIVYLFWGISFVWGLINAISMLRTEKGKLKSKLLWISLSLLPIIYIATISLIVIVFDPLRNDIILPSGEHISAENKNSIN